MTSCALYVTFPGLPAERDAVEAGITIKHAGRCALVSIAENLSSLTDQVRYLAEVTKE